MSSPTVPLSVNLMALLSRLLAICISRLRSPVRMMSLHPVMSCYLFLYLFLFVEYQHDSIQQFFLFSQQLAYAVYTLAAAGSGLEAAEQAVHFQSLLMVRRDVFLIPVQHGLTNHG